MQNNAIKNKKKEKNTQKYKTKQNKKTATYRID